MFSTFLVLLLFPQEQVQKQIENRVGPRNGFQIVESPKIQKRIQTKAKDPIKPTKRVRLHDESLEEIEQIRERIGIKLFDGPTSREFAHQLDQLNQGEDRVKRTIQDSPKTVKGRPAKGQQIEPLMRGTWEKIARPRPTIQPSSLMNPTGVNPMIRDPEVHPASGMIGNPYSKKSSARRASAINSLIATVESLDRYALELDLQGEPAKSKKMRKLSRKIRKQLLELTQARDN